LHKLQRDLNSSRLSTYFEGDSSEEEQARQRERESKITRFNEVLKLLNQMDGKYAEGGMIDLFEDYKNIPTALQEVLDEYNEAFEDGDYSGLKEALTAVESMGYTFEYGLDGEAYGLRPKNTPLSQLQGYEDSEEFATGGEVGFDDDVFDATKLDLDNSISSRVYYKGVENQINRLLKNNYKSIYDFDKNGIEWVYNNTRYEVKEEDLMLELKEALAMRNRSVVDMIRINNELPRIESKYGQDVNFAKKMYQEAKDFYQNKLRNEKAIKANDVLIDYLISRLKENKKSFATGGGVSSGIKVGDWVTLKSDGKRYKVKRVLSNNMIEITAGAKTLTVNISDVETNVKFFRSKFVPVPTNIEVKFKIGDRLKFNTKKGITEVGKVLLYKYVPTQNTIIYTIATDSGWKASVLQENLSKEYTSFTIPSDNTPSPAPKQPTQKAVVKNTPPLTTFSIPSIEVGDKIEIIGSPNLTGTVTKVLSSTNEAEVLLSDSTGMTIKKGKSVPFTFSTSKIKKV